MWKNHLLQFCRYHPCNFYTVRLAFLVLGAVLGAGIISGIDKINYLDALFVAVSANSGAGLFTVSMRELSVGSFVILAILMFTGSIFFLLIPQMMALQYYNRKCLRDIMSDIKDIDPELLQEHDEHNDALIAALWISATYLLANHVFMSLLLYAALFLQPEEPELVERHYSRFANALFLTISAFSNCGLTLSSTSIFHLQNNPLAYCLLCIPILAGNTAIPVFLHAIVTASIWTCDRCGWDAKALRYILARPAMITSHVLPESATRVLGIGILAINFFQYIFFLASSDHIVNVLGHWDQGTVAGIGVIQTVSTRTAGLQILDLRLCNQGMLLIYLLMMYLSSFPFLGTAKATVPPESEETSALLFSVVGNHSFFIFMAVVVLSFIEDDFVASSQGAVNVFYILFEAVSAYANVGLSISLPDTTWSLCGNFTSAGKLIIMFLMMLGKHRGLPAHDEPFIRFDYTEFRCKVQASIEKNRRLRGESSLVEEHEEDDDGSAGETLNPLTVPESPFVRGIISPREHMYTQV